MLVIRRHGGESIHIGEDVEILVIECIGGRVKLGINAPQHVPVMRSEVRLTREQNLAAAQTLQHGTFLGRHLQFPAVTVQDSKIGVDTWK
ncbi:MAG TPA: carbon storage regulator [Candidatus Sulfopaludibacter sp.]|jgi:carbon storage regulator|nr:carbon storage regulator [Candidatus Sulfopaludibacter sp.]